MGNFEKELTNLLNKYSKENNSNTPDSILSKYLINCLNAYNIAVVNRAAWNEPKDKNKEVSQDIVG